MGAFQEFFIIPTGAESFSESMEIGGDATLIGDEGGFAPPCDVESGMDMLMEAAHNAGYADKISVGLDVASSEFKVEGKDEYDLDFKSDRGDPSMILSGDDMVAFYQQLIAKYPIVTIEDPFDQDDWENWSKITAATDIQIVGD